MDPAAQLVFYLASAVGVLAWLSRVVENVPPPPSPFDT